MNPALMMWMLIAFLGLAGVGLSALLVMRGQAIEDRVRSRVQTATMPHLRIVRTDARMVRREQVKRQTNSPIRLVAQLLGADMERQDQYPMQWWIVVLLVLLATRVVIGILVFLIGSFGWILWVPLWIFASRFALNWLMLRRRKLLFSQFPDALAMMVRSIRAGVPMHDAIRIVSRETPQPTAGEFALISGDISIGVTIGDALKVMAERNDLTEYRFFATALTLQSQTGGRLGETLENLAGVVRRRLAMKMRGYALASEARTSAMILAALPILATGGLYLLNPEYMEVLFVDPLGRIILTAAIVSLCTGMFVMRTIIERNLS